MKRPTKSNYSKERNNLFDLQPIDDHILFLIRYRARTGKKYFTSNIFFNHFPTVPPNLLQKYLDRGTLLVEPGPVNRYFVPGYFSQLRYIGEVAVRYLNSGTLDGRTLEINRLISYGMLSGEVTTMLTESIDLPLDKKAQIAGLTEKEYQTLEDLFLTNLAKDLLLSDTQNFELFPKVINSTGTNGQRRTSGSPAATENSRSNFRSHIPQTESVFDHQNV